jgi:hypothetical protein
MTLEIVDEKAVIKAFVYVLEKDVSFMEKISIALQFIFSL